MPNLRSKKHKYQHAVKEPIRDSLSLNCGWKYENTKFGNKGWSGKSGLPTCGSGYIPCRCGGMSRGVVSSVQRLATGSGKPEHAVLQSPFPRGWSCPQIYLGHSFHLERRGYFFRKHCLETSKSPVKGLCGTRQTLYVKQNSHGVSLAHHRCPEMTVMWSAVERTRPWGHQSPFLRTFRYHRLPKNVHLLCFTVRQPTPSPPATFPEPKSESSCVKFYHGFPRASGKLSQCLMWLRGACGLHTPCSPASRLTSSLTSECAFILSAHSGSADTPRSATSP